MTDGNVQLVYRKKRFLQHGRFGIPVLEDVHKTCLLNALHSMCCVCLTKASKQKQSEGKTQVVSWT